MYAELFGSIHFLFSMAWSFYFLWRPPHFDIIAIALFLIMNLTWVFIDNKCAFSEIIIRDFGDKDVMKKTDSEDDFQLVFGKKNSARLLDYIMTMYGFNVAYVLLKGDLPSTFKPYVLAMFLSFVMYAVGLRYLTGPITKLICGIHGIVVFITLFVLPFH